MPLPSGVQWWRYDKVCGSFSNDISQCLLQCFDMNDKHTANTTCSHKQLQRREINRPAADQLQRRDTEEREVNRPADELSIHLIMFICAGKRHSTSNDCADYIHEPRQSPWQPPSSATQLSTRHTQPLSLYRLSLSTDLLTTAAIHHSTTEWEPHLIHHSMAGGNKYSLKGRYSQVLHVSQKPC